MLDAFDRWKALRVVVNVDVLGGEPVFRNTRLSVSYIGLLAAREFAEVIMADYPYLMPDDLIFAAQYVAQKAASEGRKIFIAIEGADASGKCTQTKLVNERLPGSKFYSFPRYETSLGRAILRHLEGAISVTEERTVDSSDGGIDGESYWRQAPEDAMIFQCMMTADKYAAGAGMRSSLKEGHVVADRWWPSAYVYGVADGLDPIWLTDIHASLLKADLHILLDVSLEESLLRRPARRDRYERDHVKQERVRQLYRELWKAKGLTDEESWVILAGQGSVEDVNAQIMLAINRKLEKLERPTAAGMP